MTRPLTPVGKPGTVAAGGSPVTPAATLRPRQKATNEQIIDAYRDTGSVWAAGKRLGMAGQSVHERLRAIGYPLASQNWTPAEVGELRNLVGQATIAEIAHRLGRPYNGVACKISELGIGVRFGNNRKVKVQRGAGYDKSRLTRYAKQIEATGVTVRQFARTNGLGVEMLCRAFEQRLPEWWDAYKRTAVGIDEKQCAYCHKMFVPGSGKQTYCTRQCAAARRSDESYFGGRRRETIGLAERTCQLCGRQDIKGLSSHHVIGKENDPDNDFLIALCPGCHQIVTILSGRASEFLASPEGWEALIQLCLLRKHGGSVAGIYASVDIELLDTDDIEALA